MKYCLTFELESEGWHKDVLDEWPNETVVPRVGDGVFMKGPTRGWMQVTDVGFSTLQRRPRRRLVLVSVQYAHKIRPRTERPK